MKISLAKIILFKHVIPFHRQSQWPPSAHRCPSKVYKALHHLIETTVVMFPDPHLTLSNRPTKKSNVSGKLEALSMHPVNLTSSTT